MKTEEEIRKRLKDEKQFYQKVKSLGKLDEGSFFWIKALEWVLESEK